MTEAKNSNDEANSSSAILFEKIMLLPSVLSFVVAIAVILSASHDVSYFWYIDINFLSFLTTSDLIKSTAGWVPFVLPFAFLSLMTNKVLGYDAPFLTFFITENFATSSVLRKFAALLKINIWYTISIFIFIYLMIFSVSYQFSSPFIVLVIALIFIGRYLHTHPNFIAKIFSRSRYIPSLALGFFVFLIGLGLGWSDAAGDLRTNSPTYKIKSDGVDFALIHIIRSGEKGIIYKQGSTIGFVPWDNVKGISRYSAPIKIENLPRHIFRWLTDQPPPTP